MFSRAASSVCAVGAGLETGDSSFAVGSAGSCVNGECVATLEKADGAEFGDGGCMDWVSEEKEKGGIRRN